jgi:methylamine dehydrogenase accessory protein MauD
MSTLLLLSHIILWVVVALLAAVTLAAVRQIGLIHQRIPPVGARMAPAGPAIGDEAPMFDQPDVLGRRTSLGSKKGRKTLMLFVSTHCSTCQEIAPAIRSIARSEAAMFDTILVSDGSMQDVLTYVRNHRLSPIPVILSGELHQAYDVVTTPFGLVINEHQKVVTKGIVNNIEHLESLVRAAELGVDSFETFHSSDHASMALDAPLTPRGISS